MHRLSIAVLVPLLASGCTPSAGGQAIPKASEDALLQRAYESCVIDNTKETRAQNPDLPKSLESSTMERIYHSCEIAVVYNCERNRDSEACQTVLNMYVKLR